MSALGLALLLAVIWWTVLGRLGVLVLAAGTSNLVEPTELADQDSRFADAGGVRLHYKESGEGTPSIVLLHGFGASTFSWEKVMPGLAARGRVVAIDRPPGGLSERPPPGTWEGASPYSLPAHAEQTIQLMNTLGIESAVLVGHSAGAEVAALIADEHPERVDGLILECPSFGDGVPPIVRTLASSWPLRRVGPLLLRPTGRPLARRLLHSAYSDPAAITTETIDGYLKPFRAAGWDVGLFEAIIAAEPSDTVGGLARIRTPTLVIAGLNDSLVSPESSREIAARITGSQYLLLPDVGHIPHEEAPERFLSAAYRFLDTPEEAAGDEPCDG